jgi:acetoin utilization protein AcuB
MACTDNSPQTLEGVMTTHVITVTMDETLAAIREIFHRYKFRHVIVTEHGRAVGVISDRDLLKNVSPFLGKVSERTMDRGCLSRKAHQIMTRKLISALPDMPIGDAILLMLQNRISCIPVLDDKGYCVGIVTSRDLLRWCVRCAQGGDEGADKGDNAGGLCAA